jgi:hypothetical protein
MLSRFVVLVALVAFCSVALEARADEKPAPAQPIGFTLTASLGGGGSIDSTTPLGLFEGELVLGYELGLGIRPEVGLLVCTRSGAYVGLRPGLHYSFENMPIYARLAVDWSRPSGSWLLRWVLLGAGIELRLTDIFGLFTEADIGVPLRTRIGVLLAARGGFSFRF